MKIYSNSGVLLYDLDVEDSSYRRREIPDVNELTLEIRYHEKLTIPLGSYVDYEGVRYSLKKNEHVTKNGARDFVYTIMLYSDGYDITKYKLRNPIDKRLKFSYSGTPYEHLQMIVSNLNEKSSGWSIGSYINAPAKVINYNHIYLSDAIRLIANEYNTEYELDGKKINLGKVEYFKNEPLELSIRNGFKAGIKRTNTDNKKAVDVLFVQGGEKNIDPSVYGSKELLLPAGMSLTYEGRQYRVSNDGLSLTRTDRPMITGEEDSIDLSHIHPKRVGSVTTVQVINQETNLYDFIDSSIPSDLDYSACLIAGEKMSVIFQSGMLAGREFDVDYQHDERRFKIVPQEYDGVVMPGSNFLPSYGDSYIIYGCSLPISYYNSSSTEMLMEAVKYKYENEDPRLTFSGSLDGIWSKSRWLEVGGRIKPGSYVLYLDADIAPEGILLRIMSVKDYVNSPHKPTIELSNTTIAYGVKDQITKPDREEVQIDENLKQGLNFTKRRYRDALENIKMLEKAFDEFDPAIDPIAVQTLSVLVGAEALQFRFVNSKTTPAVVTPNIVYNAESKILSAPAGIIQHMTIGITSISSSHAASEYRYWDIPTYVSPALVQGDKSYYLYARVNKADSDGVLLLSETAYKFNDSPSYYYLLVGTLTKEDPDGARSYTSVYGFTEILPGRITTDMITSPTGKTYFNLSAGDGAGEIGGVIKLLAGSSGLENIEAFSGLVSDVTKLDYLKQAILNGNTVVAGGLILSNLLMLRGVDNVVRAGLSGLKDDNVFLFADPSDAYSKALNGTAMFLLRKDGTGKLGIMKIDSENVGLYKAGVEMLQFRTTNVPTRNDLISTVDITVTIPGGSQTQSLEYSGTFTASDSIAVSPTISSFVLNVDASLTLRITNDVSTPNSNSQISAILNLYQKSGTEWVFARIIASEFFWLEAPGTEEQTYPVQGTFNMPAGEYRLQWEYDIVTNTALDTCTIITSGSAHAQGAQANKAIIFGENGFIRIKDGTNYSLFSDEAVEHKFSSNSISIDQEGVKIEGAFEAPGLKGSASVSSTGTLTNVYGKITGVTRVSQGSYSIAHSLVHQNFTVSITPYNSNAKLTAVIISKSSTSVTVKIVDSSNGYATDSAFDIAIHAAS